MEMWSWQQSVASLARESWKSDQVVGTACRRERRGGGQRKEGASNEIKRRKERGRDRIRRIEKGRGTERGSVAKELRFLRIEILCYYGMT